MLVSQQRRHEPLTLARWRPGPEPSSMKKITIGTVVLAMATCAFSAAAGGARTSGSGIETREDDPQYFAGTWTVHENGVENKSIRMVFDKHRKFRFVCSGAKSEGSYEVHDGAIFLKYEKVDGQPVSFESKKRLPLSDDRTWFQVDTYRYERSK